MTTRLLTDGGWREITRRARKARSARVAVAYFGQGASRLLPLKAGGVLVVNLGLAAVRSGQTCPDEVIRLLRRGVEVHSCDNLHAKVFVFDRRAIVGSTNVSHNSRGGLLEAAIETTDPDAVRSCKEYVDSLRGEHVDLDHARRLSKEYKPPKFGLSRREPVPEHPPFWVVPLAKEYWEPEDQEQYDRSAPTATKKLGDEGLFSLEQFGWDGGGFRRPLKIGDLVMQLIKESANSVMLSPVTRVIHIRPYSVSRQRRMIVYLRMPKVRRKNLLDLQERLSESWSLLRGLKRNPRLIREARMAHEILQLWPSLNDH